MSGKKKLKVKIFDREYSLLVDDEDIARELAAYVIK
jgi:cell division protein ZapA